MQLEEKKVYQVDEFLFMLGFIPYFIFNFLDTSTIHEIIPLGSTIQIFWNLALGVFIAKLLFDHFELNELIVYLISFATVYVSYKTSGSSALYTMLIFVLLARYVRSDLIAKVYFAIGTILFFLIITLAVINIIPNLTYFRNGFARHAFGIIYTTDFASHVFYLICGYVYLRGKSYRIYDTFFLSILGVILYMFTQARLNVICIFLLIIGRQIINFNNRELLKKIAWITPIISMVTISLLSFFYQSENAIFKLFDKLLSGRLRIVHSIIKQYGIDLFGQRIIQNGWGGTHGAIRMQLQGFQYLFIDSAYMRLLLMFGIVTTVVILGVIAYLMYQSDNKYLLLVLSVILISGIVEQHMWEIAYNPFFIILFSDWFNRRLNKKTSMNYEIN